jgi:hypothetical protein
MKTLTKKEKELWNEAVKKCTNEIKMYNGTIPDEFERNNMAQAIKDRISYKLKTKLPK